jgi:hypothetical protein
MVGRRSRLIGSGVLGIELYYCPTSHSDLSDVSLFVFTIFFKHDPHAPCYMG